MKQVEKDKKTETEAESGVSNGWLEGVYEHFQGMPIRYLDRFIMICVVTLIIVIAVGVWKAHI